MGRPNKSGTVRPAVDIIRAYVFFAGKTGILFSLLQSSSKLSKPTIIRETKKLIASGEIEKVQEGKYTRFRQVINATPDNVLVATIFGRRVSTELVSKYNYIPITVPESPRDRRGPGILAPDLFEFVNRIGAIVTGIVLHSIRDDNRFVSVHRKYSKSLVMKNHAIRDWSTNALNSVIDHLAKQLKDTITFASANRLTEERYNEEMLNYGLGNSNYQKAHKILSKMYPQIMAGIDGVYYDLEQLTSQYKTRSSIRAKIALCRGDHHYQIRNYPKEKRRAWICNKCGLEKR